MSCNFKTSAQKRLDFIMFIEVINGCPNGDPDAGNMPRTDPQTGNGLITDVCLKHKVRKYVETTRGNEDGFDIFISEGSVLNDKMKKTYEDYGLKPDEKDPKAVIEQARTYMCKRYFDARIFGAVMSTGNYKADRVTGPVQLCFGRSIDPILPQLVTCTRCASANEKETVNADFAPKYIVPYGLYRVEGFFSPALAAKSGCSDEDLAVLWEALLNMFELDHSAARGRMATRKLIVFEHDSMYGNAPSYELFDLVKVSKNCNDRPPRAFSDYTISIGKAPEGVTVLEMR